MKAKKIARFIRLLPTAVSLAVGSVHPASAAQLAATDYVERLYGALSSSDTDAVLAVTKILRSCGVTGFGGGGADVTLDEIDALATKGATSSVIIPEGSVFRVAATLRRAVNCHPSVPGAMLATTESSDDEIASSV